jgi:type II secretory pathway pseudopilin PulG
MPIRVVRSARAGDRGSTMIMVVFVMLLMTALGGVAVRLAVSDTRGSSQSQLAGRALNAAEAGIAQAINYVRANGTRKISCNLTECMTNAWSPTNQVSADLAKGARWTAWIKPLSVDNPADGDGDVYLVHSTGSAGGPAERTIETEITVTPFGLPNAIFGRTINIGGTADLQQISMFSTGCVYKRDHITVNTAAGLDAAYDVPAAVHSSQIITTSQGSGQFCPNTAKPIHRTNAGNLPLFCNTSYPYDQDRLGGSLAGLPLCLNGVLTNPMYNTAHDFDLDGSVDLHGSFIKDDRAMFKAFGIKRPTLTDSQIEQLRTEAQAQGNFYTSTTGWSIPDEPHSVLFFELGANQTVDLDSLGSSMWARTRLLASSPQCIDASLLIVVTGGNAKMNSNMNLAAGVYVAGSSPGGKITKANGTVNHIGMLYADTLDFTGNINVSLDTCYMANPHPALFDVIPGSYRELDRATTSVD